MSKSQHHNQERQIPAFSPISSAQRLWTHSNEQLKNFIGQLNTPDIQREGTLTHPQTRTPVNLEESIQTAQSHANGLAGGLMEQLAFHPSSGPQYEPNQLRFFVPGLNTLEPEASDRTQYYSEVLDQSMVHMHNGTHMGADFGDFDSSNLDYVVSTLGRLGLKNPPLLHKIEHLLEANFSQAEPQDIHAILYSDSTIHGTNAIRSFREKEIKRRIDRYPFHKQMFMVKQVTQEVDALLNKHLFVELHGNAVADLPQGPKYLVWTDSNDPLNNQEVPVLGPMGINASRQDDNPDAEYIDFTGPFGGFDAHNLQAYGVHFVKATLEANGVNSPQELHQLIQDGKPILIPQDVQGDSSKLWNPNNAVK